MKLQINEKGAWGNLITFPEVHIATVKMLAPALAKCSSNRCKLKICEEIPNGTGGTKAGVALAYWDIENGWHAI